MDLGLLPELVTHFQAAVMHLAPIANEVSNTVGNMWTGMTNPEAMSTGMRNFQILKIAGSTAGFVACITTENFEGAFGCALADGEALMDIARAGANYRALHMTG